MKFLRSVPIALAGCVLLFGCSKLTNENYSKIRIGMSFGQVTELIGKPKSCDDVIGVKSCRWGEGSASVSINFVGDQVVLHTAENIR